MNVSSLCDREVVSVPAGASVREAAVAMREHHVGALAVTDPYEPGRVIGIVTDRDLVVGLLASGRPVEGQAIGDLCQTELAAVPATASLDEAVQAMRRAGVRRLLVTQADGAITGLVSLDDLLEVVAGELGALAGTMRTGIDREDARTRPRGRGEAMARTLYVARNEP
ncbi:MAG TPA: CBS domain-containing protein [Ramlibacter sp.]